MRVATMYQAVNDGADNQRLEHVHPMIVPSGKQGF